MIQYAVLRKCLKYAPEKNFTCMKIHIYKFFHNIILNEEFTNEDNILFGLIEENSMRIYNSSRRNNTLKGNKLFCSTRPVNVSHVHITVSLIRQCYISVQVN
jgi:hypothetical protein